VSAVPEGCAKRRRRFVSLYLKDVLKGGGAL
jgi:hypothetical protein